MKKVMIVPRWGGTPKSDWYPWIATELSKRSAFSSVHICDMPNPSTPIISEWANVIGEILLAESQLNNEMVLVGHSVGCQAILHALAGVDLVDKIDTAIFVAAWWDIDKPWDSIIPWVSADHNFEKIKASIKRSIVILSDNDPFTANYELNSQLWQERLGSEIVLVPGAEHFNGLTEESVFNLLAGLESVSCISA